MDEWRSKNAAAGSIEGLPARALWELIFLYSLSWPVARRRTDRWDQTYFAKLNIAKPSGTVVSVDGAKNSLAKNSFGPDTQVTLDIEIVGAVAPRAHIVVYFAPNTDTGFLDAINRVVADSTNRPSVLSTSGGTRGRMVSGSDDTNRQSFQAATKLGITSVLL